MQLSISGAMVVMMTCIVEDAISKTYVFCIACVHASIHFPFPFNQSFQDSQKFHLSTVHLY